MLQTTYEISRIDRAVFSRTGSMRVKYTVLSCLMTAIVAGCNMPSPPEAQTSALTLNSESLPRRQLQTRRYETRDSAALMSAAVGVLQDLGYSIDESSVGTGLINASKARPGTIIRVSIVIRPTPNRQALTARVSFQAVGLDSRNQPMHAETINDATVYQQFFERLSQSIFLEGQEI